MRLPRRVRGMEDGKSKTHCHHMEDRKARPNSLGMEIRKA